MAAEKTAEIFDLPEDIIRFICVHFEYNEIITGVLLTNKRLNEIVGQFLKSNYYIYRIIITDVDDGDRRLFKISQIKYFKEYKNLLSDNDLLDKRIPITHVLLTYNFHFAEELKKIDHISTKFKPWLFKYWNNGSIYEIVTVTVNIFNRFMEAMHESQNEDEDTLLSLNNSVKYLRLTNRGAPQPINDYNRICNALSIINKYNVSKDDQPPNIYGFSIGFHVKDSRKQDYLQKSFVPFSNYLKHLKLLILHGCHKRNTKKSDDNKIDLVDGVLNAINDNIIYLDLSFMISSTQYPRNNNNNNNNNSNDDNKENEDDIYLIKLPQSVQCLNFGWDFETYSEKLVKVGNIQQLTKLRLMYIETNPKRIQVEFIGELVSKCESLDCIAINLGGLVWENLTIQQTQKLGNIEKFWKLKYVRKRELNVVVVTTQMGVHSAFKKIIDDTFCDNNMIKIKYIDRKAGIGWLYEFVNQYIANNDFRFQKLWRLYHFGRNNFSSLDVRFQ